MKNVKHCPICAAKKFIHSFTVNRIPGESYNNGAALTPPMGWSSWNLFRNKISEDLIKEIARAMKESGLLEAGYQYVNIDDCWQCSSRDENGRLQSDKMTFPSGIKSLTEYVNSLGLKLGIYSSNGTLTCEEYPASLGYEAVDADTFAQWGVEYFKYDFCHNKAISVEAPLVVKIEVGKGGKAYAERYASDAVLHGNARLIEDKKVEGGHYIKGLSSYSGEAVFEIDGIPEDGEYDFTVTIRKERKDERFLVIYANGKEAASVTVPGMKDFTPEFRVQTKIKLCAGKNTLMLTNPIGSESDSAVYQYTNMGKELKRATKEYAEKNGTQEKKIVYSICEWGKNKPWKWGAKAGNLWRTTGDIMANWLSIFALYEFNMRLSKYAAPGGWNDPDMLEVGNGELTYEENKAHFSLWCMMAAPLILGNDVRKFIKEDGSIDTDNKVWQILTNKRMISIDQDRLGIACRKIKSSNKLVDVLVKPLDGAKAAVCVFNKSGERITQSVDLQAVANAPLCNLPSAKMYKVTDCWSGEVRSGRSIKTLVESHGAEVYIVEAVKG